LTIRPARIPDVLTIAKIVNEHAAKELMLPIALNQIYEQLRDFVVAEENGEIAGCGAIHVAWEDLGEIRSLAVAESNRKKGIGGKIAAELLKMAKELGIKKIFVLTYQVDFFKRLGFVVVDKETLPHKIWRVCLNCHKFPSCDETALQLQLS
jgi:amino-acid N-acetyltransferase